MHKLRALSDTELLTKLDHLTTHERRIGAVVLAHLLLIFERSLHLGMGFPTIVEYCEGRLGLSRDVAYKRAAALRVAQSYPEVLQWLERGETSLSALALLAPHRCDPALVHRARGLSRRGVADLVACASFASYIDEQKRRKLEAMAADATSKEANGSAAHVEGTQRPGTTAVRGRCRGTPGGLSSAAARARLAARRNRAIKSTLRGLGYDDDLAARVAKDTVSQVRDDADLSEHLRKALQLAQAS